MPRSTLAVMPPLGLYINKLQRNEVYEIIANTGMDPAQFDLIEDDGKVVITHDAGSTFMVGWSGNRRIYRIRSRYRRAFIINASVEDGSYRTRTVAGRFKYMLPSLGTWANEVKEVTEAPDYWKEMKRNREFVADVNSEGAGNTPFTEDEQEQIVVSIQGCSRLAVQAAISMAGSGSHGLPLRAVVTASSAVRPWDAAESR
jgi:hypothetical protein